MREAWDNPGSRHKETYHDPNTNIDVELDVNCTCCSAADTDGYVYRVRRESDLGEHGGGVGDYADRHVLDVRAW